MLVVPERKEEEPFGCQCLTCHHCHHLHHGHSVLATNPWTNPRSCVPRWFCCLPHQHQQEVASLRGMTLASSSSAMWVRSAFFAVWLTTSSSSSSLSKSRVCLTKATKRGSHWLECGTAAGVMVLAPPSHGVTEAESTVLSEFTFAACSVTDVSLLVAAEFCSMTSGSDFFSLSGSVSVEAGMAFWLSASLEVVRRVRAWPLLREA